MSRWRVIIEEQIPDINSTAFCFIKYCIVYNVNLIGEDLMNPHASW